MSQLDDLDLGFRRRYLDHAEVTAQLQAWAGAFPNLLRLHSMGQTPQGRELWIATIGLEPDRIRPSVWVDANMHATEVAGTQIALAIAEDVLRLHLEPEAPLHGLPGHLREVVRDVLFHVMPRVSPDGADAVLHEGRWIRSVPRDDRPHRRSTWRARDLDGDGLALTMRKIDPTGEWVVCPDDPDLMVPRRLEDEGPFYKVWPEGIIENFDGQQVPSPAMNSDNAPDLNRNFPYDWGPEHLQSGAGDYPASEPESAAVVEFTTAHPEIFAWLDLHTFGGVFIRPLGTGPDETMDPADLAVFREAGAMLEALTGYPMVSGFADFTYEPGKPLRGDSTEFAYHARGCLTWVCELWDLFRQLDMPKTPRFVDQYGGFDRDTLIRFAKWDREHNLGRVVRPWVRVEHPQLGEVDVGGFDPRFGVWNPPPERLAEICETQSAGWLRIAAMAPRIVVGDPRVRALGPSTFEVELEIENRGYLPSYVLSSARVLEWNEPLHARLQGEGLELVDERDGYRDVGHLDGWGRGRGSTFGSAAFLRGTGSVSRRRLRWVVRGRGMAQIEVGSCRMGRQVRSVEIG